MLMSNDSHKQLFFSSILDQEKVKIPELYQI